MLPRPRGRSVPPNELIGASGARRARHLNALALAPRSPCERAHVAMPVLRGLPLKRSARGSPVRQQARTGGVRPPRVGSWSPFVVMEFLQGEPLGTLASRGQAAQQRDCVDHAAGLPCACQGARCNHCASRSKARERSRGLRQRQVQRHVHELVFCHAHGFGIGHAALTS
jgi:hypothetical protein